MILSMRYCVALLTTFLAGAAPVPETYTYKTAGGRALEADVYRAGPGTHPVLVWIHGGALMFGSRTNLRPAQLTRYLDAGYTVVSIDYRLAPENKIGEILADVKDAWAWVAAEGPRRFGADVGRMAVVGHSAGGYLSQMCGFMAVPRPRAVVSFYGYGDIAGDWYAKPDPYYASQPSIARDDAYAALRKPEGRSVFYLYCRQQGLWPLEVTGHDPLIEPLAFDLWCPIRNVTSSYPPTILLHGDADTDVPYRLSVDMAAELERRGVVRELVTIPGGPHGFDGRMPADPVTVRAFERVMAFLRARL